LARWFRTRLPGLRCGSALTSTKRVPSEKRPKAVHSVLLTRTSSVAFFVRYRTPIVPPWCQFRYVSQAKRTDTRMDATTKSISPTAVAAAVSAVRRPDFAVSLANTFLIFIAIAFHFPGIFHGRKFYPHVNEWCLINPSRRTIGSSGFSGYSRHTTIIEFRSRNSFSRSRFGVLASTFVGQSSQKSSIEDALIFA
jgi:hypothetical protein